MAKQDILFIGIGQCGSNIAFEFKKRGYQTFYINTTNEDVQLLDIPDNLKYHIPSATGCGRNREKAFNYTKEHFNDIDTIINTKFPMLKHIYICFSTGGGTGSGISPALLGVLSKKYPNKTFGYVATLPNSEESIDIKSNALECYSQLQKLDKIYNSFFLDNNSSISDIIEINKMFADEYDRFINLVKIKSIQGNIDDDEIEKMIRTKGNVVFGSMKKDKLIISTSFTKPSKNVDKAFLVNSPKEKINIELIEESFGKPLQIFKTEDENSTVSTFGLFGLNLPQERILQISEEVLQDSNNREEFEQEELDFIIPDVIKKNKKNDVNSSVQNINNDINISDLFESFGF